MAIRPWGVALATGSLAITLATPALADDGLSVRWGGHIQSDLRFRIERKGVGDYYNRIELPEGPERNQNTLSLNLSAEYGRFKGVAQLDFVLDGFSSDLQSVGDLYHIEKVDPYRFEAPSLYIDIKNVFVDGLDLRIGQQIVSWGVGDQFNPTNNLNADDFRDPLLFGKQAGNFMVKADYWLNDNVSISGVLVPVFKPALLPRSGVLAVAAVDRIPFTNDVFRHRIEAETAATGSSLLGAPTIVNSAKPTLPETTFENMQWSYRLAGTLAEQDLAVSYYYGRHDFPVPLANHTRLDKTPQCDPKDKSRCLQGLLKTDVTLGYPKMHVYGLNATGEIPLSWLKEELHGIGYRAEAALIVPDRSTVKLTNDALDLDIPQSAGEYDYDGVAIPGSGKPPAAVENIAFLKWVIGLDYTFGEHVYVNAQWVHGIADEYGAGDFIHEGWAVRESGVTSDEKTTVYKCALNQTGEKCARELLHPRIGDYVILGIDFKLLNNALLLRLFNILDVSGIVEDRWDEDQQKRVRVQYSPFSAEGFSMVIYPELNYNFGNGLDLGAGALFQLGKDYTKFGDPAAGGSTVWTRGKFSF
jgi:hypothetical protein